MKVLFLFTVTFMLFFLYLVPIFWDFNPKAEAKDSALGLFAWYTLLFILTLFWGSIVYNKGCWFFSKANYD